VVMRRIAARCGASAVVSEMVACDQLVRGEAESRLRSEGAGISPHIVQLAGRDPAWMWEAARIAEAEGASVIDINMGCPAKKVIGGYAGAALMRDLDLASRLISAARAAVAIPITVKMRLGWDETNLNAPLLAARAEAEGASLITVHGRTRQQFYNGIADWRAVQAVRDAITVPVIVNGDIGSAREAQDALASSGADGVMIGRAALGKPWIVGDIARALGADTAAPLCDRQKSDISIEHYEGLLALMGIEKGLRHARKHVAAYIDAFSPGPDPDTAGIKRRATVSESPSEVIAILRRHSETARSDTTGRKWAA
jgi:tRNA-dihydrouridine synthase B